MVGLSFLEKAPELTVCHDAVVGWVRHFSTKMNILRDAKTFLYLFDCCRFRFWFGGVDDDSLARGLKFIHVGMKGFLIIAMRQEVAFGSIQGHCGKINLAHNHSPVGLICSSMDSSVPTRMNRFPVRSSRLNDMNGHKGNVG
jgi:hypothetical protein